MIMMEISSFLKVMIWNMNTSISMLIYVMLMVPKPSTNVKSTIVSLDPKTPGEKNIVQKSQKFSVPLHSPVVDAQMPKIVKPLPLMLNNGSLLTIPMMMDSSTGVMNT